MSSQHIELTAPILEYVRSVSTPEPDYLVRLREETARLPNARMQITVEQGALMGMLVRLLGARKALEVGVFTGYSSLSVARALPAGGRLIACDVSAEWTSIARRYWKEAGLDHMIELHLRPALETLDDLLGSGHAASFDFAFIDADKTNYQGYYERALELLRPGGLIAVDNVLWHSRVIDPAVNDEDTRAIRAFNQALSADARVHHCLVPLGDGIMLALKK
ncbi:MAG: class I SAM-dependent methyltransferase [Bryobacterales bacterium]|nr:class I SAM-dependent methyltransferase [Bryobacterales bacterium]